ncbi:MAG: carbamoyltransferase [Opitutales bacterium]
MKDFHLGLSFGYHDSAAAIACNGELIAASEEERFSRVKNDPRFPKLAIEFCLKEAGIQASELASATYYECWQDKLDRIIKSGLINYPEGETFLEKSLNIWIEDEKFDPIKEIAKQLKIPKKHIKAIGHHESHAAATYLLSPFEEAAIVTLDGVGEYDCMTISKGSGNKIIRLQTQTLPHSLGLLYSAFTAYLGFKVNEDEYKVMGMAGYGDPSYAEKIRSLIKLHPDGTFSIDTRYFNFLTPTKVAYLDKLESLLGPGRERSQANQKQTFNRSSEDHQKYANIAASLQLVTEETILHVVRHALESIGTNNLCLGGGVALNSLANGRIQRELKSKLHIHPAAGDAGGAVGAALSQSCKKKRQMGQAKSLSPYLGAGCDKKEISIALKQTKHCSYIEYTDETSLLDHVSTEILNGKVVGWFQGRSEWGPRALGNRSILADPTHPNMQEIINRKIKFREPFRPFAPIVTPEKAPEFFEIDEETPLWGPESYMLSIKKVRAEFRDRFPAITHIDGTARIQIARKEWNPRMYSLLNHIGRKNQAPMLLNTSFNLKGEPIVNHPKEALLTFSWSDMDILVLGDTVIEKKT